MNNSRDMDNWGDNLKFLKDNKTNLNSHKFPKDYKRNIKEINPFQINLLNEDKGLNDTDEKHVYSSMRNSSSKKKLKQPFLRTFKCMFTLS